MDTFIAKNSCTLYQALRNNEDEMFYDEYTGGELINELQQSSDGIKDLKKRVYVDKRGIYFDNADGYIKSVPSYEFKT